MLPRLVLLSLLLVGAFPQALWAQRTSPEPLLIPYVLPKLTYGSVDLGDYDGDGDLDLIMTGLAGEETARTRLFELQDSTITILNTPATFKTYKPVQIIARDVWQGQAAWGDYDGDGDDDLLVMGRAFVEVTTDVTEEVPVSSLYENRGGVFVENFGVQVPGLYSGDIAWGDYDGDGDLDVAVMGATSIDAPFQPTTRIYRNDGGGALVPLNTSIPGVMLGGLDWGDYDGDGDLDLALMGRSEQGFRTQVFRNDNSTFVDSGLAFPPRVFGGLDWGDYDADGDADLLLTGGVLAPDILRGRTQVFRNDGGTFTDIGATLPGAATGQAQWGDYDGDGDLDVFIVGSDRIMGERRAWVFRNDAGTFREEIRLGGLGFSDLVVGDYNADGDLDFITTGTGADGRGTTFFFMNRIFPELLPEDLFPTR